MTAINIMNPRLEWFVKEMRAKIAKNVHKSDPREMNVKDIFLCLNDEMGELSNALNSKPLSDNAIIKECADVANFAMMLADKIFQESRPQEYEIRRDK